MKKDLKHNNLPKLSQPAVRALSSAGIYQLEHLTKFTESEIKALHGIGPNALKTLKAEMQKKKLTFKK